MVSVGRSCRCRSSRLGDHSMADQVAQMMRPLANEVHQAAIERCGYGVAEERPVRLAELLTDLLAGTPTG
jgi:hypothetical protein